MTLLIPTVRIFYLRLGTTEKCSAVHFSRGISVALILGVFERRSVIQQQYALTVLVEAHPPSLNPVVIMQGAYELSFWNVLIVVILGSTSTRVSVAKKKVVIEKLQISLMIKITKSTKMMRSDEKPPHLWSSSAFLRTLRYLVQGKRLKASNICSLVLV